MFELKVCTLWGTSTDWLATGGVLQGAQGHGSGPLKYTILATLGTATPIQTSWPGSWFTRPWHLMCNPVTRLNIRWQRKVTPSASIWIWIFPNLWEQNVYAMLKCIKIDYHFSNLEIFKQIWWQCLHKFNMILLCFTSGKPYIRITMVNKLRPCFRLPLSQSSHNHLTFSLLYAFSLHGGQV